MSLPRLPTTSLLSSLQELHAQISEAVKLSESVFHLSKIAVDHERLQNTQIVWWLQGFASGFLFWLLLDILQVLKSAWDFLISSILWRIRKVTRVSTVVNRARLQIHEG